MTEAPASWNTSYVTPRWLSVRRITLRGETGKDLLEKASVPLAYLLEHGYQARKSNNQRSDTKLCPIHQCEMKKFEKNGKSWFSHKLDDGSWCNGGKKQEAMIDDYSTHQLFALHASPCRVGHHRRMHFRRRRCLR